MTALTWLGHSTVVIDMGGTRLVTDPVLRRRVWHLRRELAVDLDDLGRLDGILVSHIHFDHLDLPSLGLLDAALPVVIPRGAGRLARRRGFETVLEVEAGEEVELGPVRVRATHAEHESRRRPLSARAPSLGYLVGGSVSVYFAGDTDLFEGMGELGPIDVALLPVAGWGPRLGAGHLDPERAAAALRFLRPRIAVPIHFGTFRTPLAAPPGDGPARSFAREARRIAPEVEVRVLEIGETLAVQAVG